MVTRLLLADDHKVVRRGLRALLKDQGNMEVVGEADDGRLAVQMTGELSPDAVIMDAATVTIGRVTIKMNKDPIAITNFLLMIITSLNTIDNHK